MKLEISEVYFIQQAVTQVNIKASDAPVVAALIGKLDKEFTRLQKLEDKKQAAAPMLEAAK